MRKSSRKRKDAAAVADGGKAAVAQQERFTEEGTGFSQGSRRGQPGLARCDSKSTVAVRQKVTGTRSGFDALSGIASIIDVGGCTGDVRLGGEVLHPKAATMASIAEMSKGQRHGPARCGTAHAPQEHKRRGWKPNSGNDRPASGSGAWQPRERPECRRRKEKKESDDGARRQESASDVKPRDLDQESSCSTVNRKG